MNPFNRITMRLRKRMAARAAAQPEYLRVVNPARETVLATHMEVAATASRRNRGLLGRAQLAQGEGLWIVPCESVHTFAMRFPIDLVYLDRGKRVRKLRSAVPPWRISACLSAHSVLELPAGTIRASRTEKGDILEFAPAAETAR